MALLSAVILLAGMVIGSALTILVGKNPANRYPKDISDGERMTRRIAERLDLSDEQFKKIKPIIKEHMTNLRDIKLKARPSIETEIAQMQKKISALLTEEQKETWKKHIERLERGFEMRRPPHRRHAPGKGPGDDRQRRFRDRRNEQDYQPGQRRQFRRPPSQTDPNR